MEMGFQSQLAGGRVVLIDGGVGSELRRRGQPLSRDTWSGTLNLTEADLLASIHGDYIRAGAEIITVNTFGTSRFVLDAAGLGDRFLQINRRAIEAAKKARETSGTDVAIAGSLSCMPPAFDARAYPAPAVEQAAYRELAELFAAEGLDLLLLEMLQDAPHAERACLAARESGLPLGLGLSCRRDSPETALTAFDRPDIEFSATLESLLRECEPEVVSVMHSPLDTIGPALDVVKTRWSGVLGAYAEIAYPEDPGSGVTVRMTPEAYAREARAWIDAGVRVIGGCCGTTPDHIAALREMIDAL